MTETLNLLLYSPRVELPLHESFEAIDGVRILGRASTRTDLMGWMRSNHIDMVAVVLGGEDDLAVVEGISEASPGTTVIGIGRQTDPTTIISAMRAGCGQFVPWPIDMDDLRSAVNRIRASRTGRNHDSMVICAIGSSGGVGSTTIACNLAIELGRSVNRQCALIDMDLEFGDVGCFLDSRPMYSVVDLCGKAVELDRSMVEHAFLDLPAKVSVLLRPEHLEATREATPEGVASMIALAEEIFPFVVIDLPRSSGPLGAAALEAADLVLIVTQLGVSPIRNATRIHECLSQMDVPEENIEIVLNRCGAESAGFGPDKVAEHFNKPVFATIPNDYRRAKASLDRGRAIVASAPKSPVGRSIREMALRIAQSHSRQEDALHEHERGRFLGWFWQRKPHRVSVVH